MGVPRKYVSDKNERVYLMQLTKHSTITRSDEQALKGLGVKLIEVNPPERN